MSASSLHSDHNKRKENPLSISDRFITTAILPIRDAKRLEDDKQSRKSSRQSRIRGVKQLSQLMLPGSNPVGSLGSAYDVNLLAPG